MPKGVEHDIDNVCPSEGGSVESLMPKGVEHSRKENEIIKQIAVSNL